MIELKFFGRAGQGGKTASELIADTALDEGKFTQAFPEYGPEREGAPVKAFVRIDSRPVRLHCQITNPDAVIVIDPTLIGCIDVAEGLKDEGLLVVNTSKSPSEIRKKTGFKGKIAVVDATRISIDIFGKSFPNMPILGALVRASGIVRLESLKSQITCIFLEKIGGEKTKKNIEAAEKAYNEALVDER